MKLALLYTVFNGEELLEQSIANHIDHVDTIVICFQEISNKGNVSRTIKKDLLNLCIKYQHIVLSEFFPNLNLSTKQNERAKHNQMLDIARALDATHFIMAACDHFYMPEHIRYGQQFVVQHNMDATYTQMYTYYKYPTWTICPIEEYFMPFICRLNEHTRFIERSENKVHVDPALYLPKGNMYTFPTAQAILHHFSMIRLDIRNKFANAAASIRWTPEQVEQFIAEYENAKPGDRITYFPDGRYLVQVPDFFKIKLQ